MDEVIAWKASRGIALCVCAVLAGCVHQPASQRASGATVLSESASAEVLKSSPSGDAVRLGTVRAQVNNEDSAACEAELVSEAQRLGANAVLPTPSTGAFGRASTCEGTAYRIKK